MSEHQFEVKKEYRTRNGRRCVIVAHDPDLGMIWKVQRDDGGWFCVNESCGLDHHRPVPPERTVDQWAASGEGGLYVHGGWSKVGDADIVPIRWTIGSDGLPAYAVRLNDDGEPMYEVKRRATDE